MKFESYLNLGGKFKSGDVIYACAYSGTLKNDGRSLFQKPIKGIFTVANTEAKNKLALSKGCTGIRYFVPFKINGVDLSWCRAVRISSRCYATSMEECIELYNSLVNYSISWHEDRIKGIRKDLIVS